LRVPRNKNRLKTVEKVRPKRGMSHSSAPRSTTGPLFQWSIIGGGAGGSPPSPWGVDLLFIRAFSRGRPMVHLQQLAPGAGPSPGFDGNQKKLQEAGGGYPRPPPPNGGREGVRGGVVRPPLFCSQILGEPNFGPQKLSSALRADSGKKYLVWCILAQNSFKTFDRNTKSFS